MDMNSSQILHLLRTHMTFKLLVALKQTKKKSTAIQERKAAEEELLADEPEEAWPWQNLLKQNRHVGFTCPLLGSLPSGPQASRTYKMAGSIFCFGIGRVKIVGPACIQPMW